MSSSTVHGLLYLAMGIGFNVVSLALILVSIGGIIATIRNHRKQSLPNSGLNLRIKLACYAGIIIFLGLQVLYHVVSVGSILILILQRMISGVAVRHFTFGTFMFWTSNCWNLISQYFILLFATYISVEVTMKCVQENIFNAMVVKVYGIVLAVVHAIFVIFCFLPLVIINLVYLAQNDNLFYPRESTTSFYVFIYWKQVFNVLLLISGVVIGVMVTFVMGSTTLTKIKEYALMAQDSTQISAERFENDDDEEEENMNLTTDERMLKKAVSSMIKMNAYLVVLLLVFLLHVTFYNYALFNNQSFSLLDVDLTNYAFEKGTAIMVMIGLLLQLRPGKSAISHLIRHIPGLQKSKVMDYIQDDYEKQTGDDGDDEDDEDDL